MLPGSWYKHETKWDKIMWKLSDFLNNKKKNNGGDYVFDH